ncbi:MAG: CC/Se motif family (seleno)protein [Desulfitobacteriaceae bacterium]
MERFPLPKAVLTVKAQEYLNRAGVQNLYVEQVNIQQCCIPLISPPVVRKGIPLKPANFITSEYEGYTIYFAKNLQWPPVFTIDTQNFGIAKTLVIKDWRIAI